MSIYSDFESRVGTDLSDPSHTLIAAADIDRHVDHAVRDLALVAPLDLLIPVTLTNGSRTLDLTSALSGTTLIRLEAVEWPVGRYPREFIRFDLFGDVDPVLTLLVEQAPTQVVSLVHTSDFEDQTLDGWSPVGTGSAVAYDNGAASTGSWSLAVTPGSTANSGAQDTADTLTAGAAYTAQVWLLGVAGRSYTWSAIRTDTQAVLASVTVTATGYWQELTITWVQPAAVGVKCQLVDTAASAPQFWLDTFTLNQVLDSSQLQANLYCKVAPVVTSNPATSTLPPRYDDVVALGAAGYAAQEVATRLMNTINVGGPVVWEHYLTLSTQLLADFGQELDLIAQKTQFFVRRMYAPEYPPTGLSQSEVYPPILGGGWLP